MDITTVQEDPLTQAPDETSSQMVGNAASLILHTSFCS